MSNVLHSGDADRIGTKTNIIITPQGLSTGSFHSIGFSNTITAQISEIASANPASLSNYANPALGISFAHSSKIDTAIQGMASYEQLNSWIPASFGLVYPINKIRLAMAYHQKYSSALTFYPIKVTTVDDPDGAPLQSLTLKKNQMIHSFSGLISYPIKKVLTDSDILSLGLQLSVDYITYTEEINRIQGSMNAHNFSWKLGGTYRLSEKIHLGLFYEKGIDVETVMEFENENRLVRPDSTLFMELPEATVRCQLPDQFVFGFLLHAHENLSFTAAFASIYWHSVGDNYKNTLEISAGAIYRISEWFDMSLSIYNTNRELKEDYFNTDLEATFIGAGIRLPLTHLDIRLELLDSHLFSGDARQQTIIKFGLDYMM